MEPEVDVAASGISFIDILFALVVTVILDPVQSWARNPIRNSLPAGTISHLIVALVLVLTSWVGYHNSANKPQFKVRFFNYEIVKFALDILMVITYFVVASLASRRPLTSREEVLLILLAFGLYLLWDVTGYLQKKPGNKYEKAWELERAFTPEIGPWSPRKLSRMIVTGCFLVLLLVTYIVVRKSASSVTFVNAAVIDGILITILVGYRFTKDHVGT